MKKDKGPFAPISLAGKQASWFVDYLEGKAFPDKSVEGKRKKVLNEAERMKSSDVICLN